MKIRTLFLPIAAFIFLSPARAQVEFNFDSRKPIALRKVARFTTLSSKHKNLTAKVIYPTFRARTRLARYANAQIRAEVVPPYGAWVKENTAQAATSSLPYQYSVTPDPAFFLTPRLISTSLNLFQFTGGAHGMSVMMPLNYGLLDGKPKTLVLGDFFRPGTPYRKAVESRIFAKLRKNPSANFVTDGSVKTLETAQFNNFIVERDGLRWLFNQYEVAAYAMGQFEVKLSVKELGPGFRREMLS